MFEKRESETIRRVCDKKYTLSTSDEKTEVKWQTILVVNGEFKYLAILSK